MLANGINLPLVMMWGCVLLAPLTLLVALVESAAFRVIVGIRFRKVFWWVLGANIASTIAGGALYSLQDGIIEATGIMASIPEFVHGYTWVGILLIFLYFVKSVIVEGLIVGGCFLADRAETRWAGIVKALLAGNVITYCLVGPLFYFATRPTFGHAELLDTTAWTANSDLPVYFIDTEDQFIKAIRADGSDLRTVVPFPADAFLMSEDATAFVYLGTDDGLYLYRQQDAQPTFMVQTENRYDLHNVSLSHDASRVAYVDRIDKLKVFDVATGETVEVSLGQMETTRGVSPTSWSSSGESIYVRFKVGDLAIHRGAPPWDLIEMRDSDTPHRDEPVVNYLRTPRTPYDWMPEVFHDKQGSYEIDCEPGLVAHVRVSKNGDHVMAMRNDYGLLKLGLPGPHSPTFLPNGSEAILEWWGQLYILDYEHRRLGLLTRGEKYVLPTSRFQVHF